MAYKKVEMGVKRFEKTGDSISGIYESREDGAMFGNLVYKIRQDNGETMIVFSTTILESKMAGVKIGDKIKIEYLGEKENKKKGQNPIKLFEVFKWE